MSNVIKTLNKPELLAPAGNIESFYGVIRAGADAVYLAGAKFGARAYADNFSEEQLLECIKFAHLYNKKVYLTVNTLIKESEFDDLISFMTPLYEAGIDGVIIQDIGVFKLFSCIFPGLELHASTQMTITGVEGALFARELGACRIVPARELSLAEIIEIKQKTGLQIECFIHGAMCYSYSGQCLFSSCIGQRSGNRGRCAQPCRLSYTTEKNPGKEIYPLSLKDMCTIDILPELIKSGIDSFKIEGRMKKPEYAAGVTSVYRKYIDEYFNKGSVSVSRADRNLLENLYIRSEISEGYYHRYNGKQMVTYTSPSYNGASDSLLETIRNNYLGDKPFLDLKKYRINYSASFVTGEKAFIQIYLPSEELSVEVYGDVVDKAQNKAITSQDIAKQLGKLGNTVFCCDITNNSDGIYVSEDAYYSLKGINELRREAVNKLETSLLNLYGFRLENNTLERDDNHNLVKHSSESGILYKKYTVLINNIDQLNKIISYCTQEDGSRFINRLYIPEELFFDCIISKEGHLLNRGLYDNLTDKNIPEVYIACPYIRRLRDLSYQKSIINVIENFHNLIKGVLVRNLEDYNWIKKYLHNNPDEHINNKIKTALDFGIYCWNSYALSCITSDFQSVGLPLELNGYAHKELIALSSGVLFEKMVYGRYPLMHSANCIRKTSDECLLSKQPKEINSSVKENISKFTCIKDRTGRYIPVYTDCRHCSNTVYNAVPLTLKRDLLNKYSDVLFRLDFTDEDVRQMSDILNYYCHERNEISWEYTNGFEKHSTE